MMFQMLALNQIVIVTPKEADYLFTDSVSFSKTNACSCVIEAVERNETSTNDINIGTNGTTVTASYVISAADVSSLVGDQVMRITLTAKQETSGGTLLATDSFESALEGTLSASLSISDIDITGTTVWIGLEIENVTPL